MIRQAVTAMIMAAGFTLGIAGSAVAAPPTVVPSPGYDQRLVESRRALGSYHEHRPVVVVPHHPRRHIRRHDRHRR